jgi:hypothetical protein
MGEAALVESRVADAIQLLQRLDAVGEGPTLAVWYYYEDVDDWRLIFAGPVYDSLLPKQEAAAYKKLAEALASASISSLSVSDLKILATTSPLALALRLLIRTPPQATARAYFSNTTLNGIFIKEMIILRAA